MLRFAGILVGGVLGCLVDALLGGVAGALPSPARATFVEGLALLAYPIARLLSFVLGSPLQAEAAMLVYAIAIPATFIVIGMIGGWVIPRWRYARRA